MLWGNLFSTFSLKKQKSNLIQPRRRSYYFTTLVPTSRGTLLFGIPHATAKTRVFVSRASSDSPRLPMGSEPRGRTQSHKVSCSPSPLGDSSIITYRGGSEHISLLGGCYWTDSKALQVADWDSSDGSTSVKSVHAGKSAPFRCSAHLACPPCLALRFWVPYKTVTPFK